MEFLVARRWLLLILPACSADREAPRHADTVTSAASSPAEKMVSPVIDSADGRTNPSFGAADTVPLGSVKIVVSRLADERLAEALSLGPFMEPRSLYSEAPPVQLRLWRIPREGTCVEGTHFVCQHDYLLTVNSGDLGEVPPVFSLGRVGEITDFAWVSEREPWTVRLTVGNYPVKSYTDGVSWRLQSTVTELQLNYDSVWVRR